MSTCPFCRAHGQSGHSSARWCLVGLDWRDDDTLDLQLEFGCGARTSRPVIAVGPIHIVYHYGDPGHTPKQGYESFRRRDLPREPCP